MKNPALYQLLPKFILMTVSFVALQNLLPWSPSFVPFFLGLVVVFMRRFHAILIAFLIGGFVECIEPCESFGLLTGSLVVVAYLTHTVTAPFALDAPINCMLSTYTAAFIYRGLHIFLSESLHSSLTILWPFVLLELVVFSLTAPLYFFLMYFFYKYGNILVTRIVLKKRRYS